MKTQKILALVLAVLMLLSCAPVFVFAANLPTPQNVQVSGGDDNIEVSWDAITDFNARRDLYYFNVLYSTDKTNWQLAAKPPRDSALTGVSEPLEGSFVPGTTYYFAMQCVGWNGELGPISAPSAGIKFTSSKGELLADWNKAVAGYKSKTTEKGTNYDKVHLVKDEKIVWDNGLYTLTVLVTAVTKTKVTLKITMKSKTGINYGCDPYGGVRKVNDGGPILPTVINGTKTVTIDLSELADGANYLGFSIRSYGTPTGYSSVAPVDEYNEYSDKLSHPNRQHMMYFQKAPEAAALGVIGENLKITSSSISFGSAYKSAAKNVKSSGSILYYKAAGDKKWSKKTIAAGKTLSVSKLKPNTQYSIRTVNYVKSPSVKDKNTLITSKSGYSNTLKLRTGIGTAPDIKSIKVSSKVVTVHHNAEWWYNGAKWIYKEAYDSKQTNFTVTVTLKNVPSGMKALQCSGLGALNTQIRDVKKNSTTFTFTGTAGGSDKGKNINLTFLSYTNKFQGDWYAGTSPSVKKSVKL